MSPYDVLVALVEAGVDVALADGRLRFRAEAGALTADLREQATACRPTLVALVEIGGVLPLHLGTWPQRAREAFEERAAMREFEGGASRCEAERAAEREVRVLHVREFVARMAPRRSS